VPSFTLQSILLGKELPVVKPGFEKPDTGENPEPILTSPTLS